MTNVLATETDVAEQLAGADGAPVGAKRRSRRSILLRRFFRNRTAVFGMVVYLMLVFLAVFGPMLSDWDYKLDPDLTAFMKPPEGEWRAWEWFGGEHWFGTTQDGADLFAMTIEGLRKSMIVGLVVALMSTSLAAVVGSFAAYFGGIFERVALWVIDLLLILPAFLIIAVIMAGKQQLPITGLPLLVVMLALLSWMLSARVVRSMTMAIRDREYVVAAKYMGVSGPRIVFRHILPNISSLLVIDASLNVATAVLAETSLSYFGYGVQSPDVSLGTLIGQHQQAAVANPWLFWFPAAFLTLMVVSINFIGDGIRDAFDPSSKSAGTA